MLIYAITTIIVAFCVLPVAAFMLLWLYTKTAVELRGKECRGP